MIFGMRVVIVGFFVAGCMYLPYPLNALLMLLAFVLIVLGVIAALGDNVAAAWHSLRNRDQEEDEPDYIPYVTTKYRRNK